MEQVWKKSGKSLECFSSEDKLIGHLNGNFFASCLGGVTSCSSNTGQVVGRADCPEDQVLVSTLDHQANILYTAHKSGLVRAWTCPTLEPYLDMPAMKLDHKAPVVQLASKGSKLISAAADGVIKVWHLVHRHCTGILRNCSALPLCLEYGEYAAAAAAAAEDDDKKKLYVLCGTVAGTLHLWNEQENALVATETRHNSQVSCVHMSSSTGRIVSCGRDKTLIFWDFRLNVLKIVPVFEEIETLVHIGHELVSKGFGHPNSGGHFLTSAGEKGQLRLWDVDKMVEILPPPTHKNKKEWEINAKAVVVPNSKINHVFLSETFLAIVQDDLISQCTFDSGNASILCSNQHETLDMCVVADVWLVIATMSPIIKVYNAETGRLIVAQGGHTSSVLSVCQGPSENTFVSCGKDHSVCLWSLDQEEEQVHLIAKGSGHSSYVGAVACADNLIFSASKDGILKAWIVPQHSDSDMQTLRTLMAHDQEINSLSVSKNGSFVASASQDKTCKLWKTKDLSMATTLRGHKRGIWCVQFSNTSILTASADCTVKVWHLTTYQCLATLEGHLSSVLSVSIIDERRIATVSSDGLLKVWDGKSGNVLGTVDAHEDKIWCVCYCPSSKELATCGRDGNIFFWSDHTEEFKREEREKSDQLLRTEQALANLLQAGQLSKALKLSLKLDRPRQSRRVLHKLQQCGQLEQALGDLNKSLRNILLQYATKWNTVGGNSCDLAQRTIKVLLQQALVDENNVRPDPQQVAGLVAYSDKHFNRMDKLHSRVKVVDLLLQNM